MAQSVFPKARTALLLVDVVNLFDFPRGPSMARRSLGPAKRIRSWERARTTWQTVIITGFAADTGASRCIRMRR